MKFLSDDALAKVAAYYASLEPPPAANGSEPPYADPVALGKAAAAPCAKCHGDNGVSHKCGVPNLIGLHSKYLLETMQAYKSGDRPVDDKNKDMKTALDALSDEDLGRIALYYALQTEGLTHAQTPAETSPPPTKEALDRLREVPRRERGQHDADHAESCRPGLRVSAQLGACLQGRRA